jgi:hypothetical protein
MTTNRIPKPETHGQQTRPQSKRETWREYDQRRKQDPRLAAVARLRNSPAYRDFRAWFQRRHPLCCDPFKAHWPAARAMTQVHHIEGLIDRPDTLRSERDCAPLCNECHGRISAAERDGKDTRHLFDPWRAMLDDDNKSGGSLPR